MSKIYFISDLHLGHKNILKFSPSRGGTCMKSHAEWLVDQWNTVVLKRDIVYVLGDVCFDKKYLHYLKQMNGQKNLILGNHDEFNLDIYKNYFNNIHGFKRYKGYWLSHAPIHTEELRGFDNIHGHVHSYTLKDRRYINVSVEAVNGIPLSIDLINKNRNGMLTCPG